VKDSEAHRFLEVLPEPAFLIAADGQIVASNSAAVEAGLCVAGSRQPLFQLWAEAPQLIRQRLAEWMRSGRLLPGRVKWRLRDGSTVQLRCDGGAIGRGSDRLGPLVLLRCTTVDQTAARFLGLNTQIAELSGEVRRRRAAEERLQEAAQELQALNESLETRVAERTALAERQAEQLRILALSAAQAVERERRRLASVLHDHLQQLLVAARMRLNLLHSEAGSPDAVNRIEELIDQALGTSRSLVMELSPPVLADAGLISALHWLRRRMKEQFNFELELNCPQQIPAMDADLQSFLFSAIRELVFNAIKHSGTDLAQVTLAVEGMTLCVAVCDRGRGFDMASPMQPTSRSGYGLLNMEQRVRSMNGTVEIDSAVGRGTRIELRLPISTPSPDSRQRQDRTPVASTVSEPF
jgi:signal transduction histidine kinase